MKIAVNTRLLLKNKLEGIGWFTFETLKRITQQHKNDQFYFLFDRPYSKEFIFSDNIEPIVVYPPTRHPFLWYTWLELKIPLVLKKLKPDIFVSPDGFTSLNTKILTYTVIHDINFYHYPKDIPFFARHYYNYYFPKYAQKSTRLGTVSQYSQTDIENIYHINPEKIDILFNGCNEIYSPANADEYSKIVDKYDLKAGFFLYIGSLHPRKNIERLLQAFELFRKNIIAPVKLVIVGEAMFKTETIIQMLKTMEFRNSVVFTGRLHCEEIRLLLSASIALTFVPYFEGFGIPVLEAMACKTSVIASNVTSIPEVAGDAAMLVNPFSTNAISRAMMTLYKDKDKRDDLIRRGQLQREKFGWDITSSLLWTGIRKAVIDSNS